MSLVGSYCPLLPAPLLPWVWVLTTIRTYLATLVWLLCVLFGLHKRITVDCRDAKGSELFAAKHQSAFDTLILHYQTGHPAIILRWDLLFIPAFV